MLDWHHHAIAFPIRAAELACPPVYPLVIDPAAVTTGPVDHTADSHLGHLRWNLGRAARKINFHKVFIAHGRVRDKRVQLLTGKNTADVNDGSRRGIMPQG